MHSNELIDSADHEHLLMWLGSTACERQSLRSLDQLKQSSVVTRLLSQVNRDFFHTLEQGKELDLGKCVGLLDQYLQCQLGKTVKPRHRKKLIQECDPGGLLRLLLFVAVHCQERERFIGGILQLPAQIQQSLRQIIEHTDSQIENIMEIREILDKVDELEGENDQLRAQLRQETLRGEELEERLAVVLLDYRQLEDEFDALKREKTQVLKQLNIQIFGEYLQLYRLLQAENQQLAGSLQQHEQLSLQLERDKAGYKAKIMDDAELITNLNEQLERFKGMCKSLRLSNSFSFLDLDRQQQTTQQELDCHALKENRLLSNLELSTSTSLGQHSKRNSDDWADTPLYFKLKHELELAYGHRKQLEELSEIQRQTLQDCQHQRELVAAENSRLREQLDRLRELQEQFEEAVEEAEAY